MFFQSEIFHVCWEGLRAKEGMYIFDSIIFSQVIYSFSHVFMIRIETRYLLYSFQELRVTLPILLTKKFYSVGLKLLMFFAVVKSTANRDDRDRGRNLDRGTTPDLT